jgi:hypothetical protein
MKSSEDDDFESALPLCPNDRPDAGDPVLSLDGVPNGMPPIALLDEDGELEPEPDGVPNPDDEDEDEDGELELELDGIPNPEAAAEAKAELGGVNPAGTFIPTGGWPPALALEAKAELGGVNPVGTFIPREGWPPALALGGRPGLPGIEPESCEPLSEPAGGAPT